MIPYSLNYYNQFLPDLMYRKQTTYYRFFFFFYIHIIRTGFRERSVCWYMWELFCDKVTESWKTYPTVPCICHFRACSREESFFPWLHMQLIIVSMILQDIMLSITFRIQCTYWQIESFLNLRITRNRMQTIHNRECCYAVEFHFDIVSPIL